jgi:hydrogenase-4 component B
VLLLPDPLFTTALLGWLWAGVATSLVAAALAALHPRTAAFSAPLSTLGGALATALGIVLVVTGGTLAASAGQVLGFAPIDFRYDGLGGVFLVAFGISVTTASLSIVGAQPRSRLEAATYPLFLASMVLVIGAASAIAFLFAWELMALLSAVLVVGRHPSRAVVSTGYLYLAMTHVATAALLVGFAILAAGSGGATDFEAWRTGARTLAPAARDLVFLLVLVGFGTKAGAMPLHSWLPRAHPVAPSHVSAVMSGVMIKMGIYGLIRILLDVMGGGPDWWGLVVLGVGAASAVLGVLYALMQHDLKRLLAFHSIENIGIILLGVGSALVLGAHGASELAALALAAALFHSVNHAVFKSLLFLGAGAVLHATGLRNLNRLGGLARRMPVTALAFGIGAAAISGLPPLNGFASEWLTFQGLLGTVAAGPVPPIARLVAAAMIGALALTAALAVACFVKATGITFLGLPRSAGAANAHETSRPARAAMGLLAAACVVLGLGAGLVVPTLTTVAHAVLGSAPGSSAGLAAVTSLPRSGSGAAFAPIAVGLLLLAAVIGIAITAGHGRARARRVDTWTCGIAPEPAFQYTATSFAKPIALFFRRILLPEREIVVKYHPGTRFPVSIIYRSEVTLFLEDRVFRPAHAASLRLANVVRRLQGGAIQLYLAYIVVAVLALLVWAR